MSNPQAFPKPDFLDPTGDWPFIERGEDGMTLRDYFAGQALAGLAANQVDGELSISANAEVAAHWAFVFADAMLEARR